MVGAYHHYHNKVTHTCTFREFPFYQEWGKVDMLPITIVKTNVVVHNIAFKRLSFISEYAYSTFIFRGTLCKKQYILIDLWKKSIIV